MVDVILNDQLQHFKSNNQMQGERTPKKPTDNDQNTYYNVEFTSGKHMRRVKIDVFSAKREEVPIKRRFFPFVNALADQLHSSPQQQNPQTNEQIKRQIEEVSRKGQQKQQCLNQLKARNSAKYDRIKELLSVLKEKKLKGETQKHELLMGKKNNLKAGRKLELLKEKTHDQVEQMRMMTKYQEQSMYQCNRFIFEKEKEKQQMAQEIIQAIANDQEISILLRNNQAALQETLTEERALEEVYNTKNTKYQELTRYINEQILQVAVLKMQINPYLRASFEALHGSQSSKKKVLEKNPNIWQKRNKILYKEEIKYFLLIQLYPSWRRLLDRLSYHFIGYRQLLCQQSYQDEFSTLKDLENYIFTNGMKKTASKLKSYIVFYSPKPQSYDKLKEVLMELEGFNNGMIEVLNVAFEKTENENIELVNINYSFKEEKRVKTIEIVRLIELSKEALLPYIPKGTDKTALIRIQIPFCFDNLADRIKMEEIYKLVIREK